MKALIKLTRRARLRRGGALMLCLIAMMVTATITFSLYALSSTSSRLAYRSWQKTQANALAEAGLSELYAQISNVYTGQPIDVAPIPTTTVTGSIGPASQVDGTYSAKVISSSSTYNAGVTVFTYKLQGTGVSPNGKAQSIEQATFTMSTKSPLGFFLGDGAIKSAGSVTLSGGGFTKDTSGKQGASIFANGSISDSGGGGITIDGIASAYGGVSGVAGHADSIVAMASPMSFPDSTTTGQWRSMWLAQAQQATASYPSGHNISGNLSLTKSTTFTAPGYISGNLSLSGGSTLTIAADPAASKPVVLFVHGSVTVSGNSSLINQGVIIVSDGSMSFSGGSNTYAVTDMANSGLISYSTDSTSAVTISGGAGVANIGVVYAVNGGAKLTGGSEFVGSLTTGGVGSSTVLSGGSSIDYAAGWNLNNGPFVPKYVASSLSKYVTLK